MNIKDNKLIDFICIKEQGKIPIFQRQYSWKEDDCIRLVDDIRNIGESKNDCHFIGSIIYENDKNDSGVAIKYIIDGQQRLTTISLFILALGDYCEEYFKHNLEKKEEKLGILHDYLFNSTKREDLMYKIQFNDDRQNEDYKKLLKNRKSDSINKNSKFYTNYQIIINRLREEKNNPELYFKGIDKLKIVDIEIEKKLGDDAQLIFETVNGTGIDLNGAELIKNYILMKVPSNNQDLLYRDCWRQMELQLKKDFNKFFRYYLITVLEKVVNSREKEFYEEFKKYAKNKEYKEKISTEQLVRDEICNYSVCYNRWINASAKSENKLDIALYQLKKTRQNVVTPVVLFLLKNLNDSIDKLEKMNNEKLKKKQNKIIKNKERTIISILNILESYFVRFRLCEIDTKNIGDAWLKILIALKKEMSVQKLNKTIKGFTGTAQEMPDDKKVQESLKTNKLYKNEKWCRYILDRIENSLNKDYHHDGKWTIEHIMPKIIYTKEEFIKNYKNNTKWPKYDWISSLGKNWKEIHDNLLDTIGNLTLSGYNPEYQNFTFLTKRDLKDKNGDEKMGYKFSTIRMTESLKKYNKWSEKEILDREKMMSSQVIKIWPFVK